MMHTLTGTATRWLDPLTVGTGQITELDLARQRGFETELEKLLEDHPIGPQVAARRRAERLLAIRRELARTGYLAAAVPARHGGCGRPAAVQTLMQFVCGYRDIDLRDATGLGHGTLIAAHATPPVRDRWLPRLLAGDLPGIALTEPHGGSQPHATTTTATRRGDGTWALTGRKTWISRLNEAAVFCMFFTDPAGRLSAGVIDATAPGLHRTPARPAGLSGWTWGQLRLDQVPLRQSELLGQPGQGMRLIRDHFTHYRPLVTATALGAAARVHDTVTAHLNARRAAGTITAPRDNALITLGRSYAQINAALLAALATQRLAEAGDPRAGLWARAIKAHGIDTAYQATTELALLAGAVGFTDGCPIAKARSDLAGLLYADGIHDSLYRSAGRALTTSEPPSTSPIHDVPIPLPTAIAAGAQ